MTAESPPTQGPLSPVYVPVGDTQRSSRCCQKMLTGESHVRLQKSTGCGFLFCSHRGSGMASEPLVHAVWTDHPARDVFTTGLLGDEDAGVSDIGCVPQGLTGPTPWSRADLGGHTPNHMCRVQGS